MLHGEIYGYVRDFGIFITVDTRRINIVIITSVLTISLHVSVDVHNVVAVYSVSDAAAANSKISVNPRLLRILSPLYIYSYNIG